MTDVDPDGTVSDDDGASPLATVDLDDAIHVTEPSEAFQALGNEIRTSILETVRDRSGGAPPDARVSFSTLFEASSVDTTAGFAYHLDELVGPFLEKTDEGYALTAAGRRVARAIESGTFTRRVDRADIPIDDPCPFCAGDGLEAMVTDTVVTIACRECDRPVLKMDFPPGGFAAHGEDIPAAFDRHHRHRIDLLGDGVCPECSGRVERAVEVVAPDRLDDAFLDAEGVPDPVQAAFACEHCGYDLQCPVAHTLLSHPAVVSFFHDHDAAVAARPIWNVGPEWSETPLSHDPIAVRVAVTLEDETLECYVDGAGDVVETRRVDESREGIEHGGGVETAPPADRPEADAA
ncbi:DUF7351 domain-containing protein [Halovivax limisalsi]|uniref:DUF7351 domain-containing protein n=1 Tax=Halovivax limisalsi TaxID=1453760 RepID=UPI001FFC51F1|nr:ArsR family transcriptional regulator [Halovivax limisalsi]